MTIPWTMIALIPPGTLALVGLLSFIQPGPRPRWVGPAVSAASWLGPPIALTLATLVSLQETIVSPLLGAQELGASVRLDSLSVLIFSMVALLAVIVIRFSRTYLDGDGRQGAFLGQLGLTIAAVEVLVISGNLLLFLAAWVATSLCLHQLLVFYRDRPGAVVAARKKFIAARIGDASIIAAGALLYDCFGTGDLGTLFARAATAEADVRVEIATLLLACAALFKSAQFPTHGWLVEVMETPTPVSALLHAGILNAGPFLVLRFASLMELGTYSAILLVVVGGFTALFASVVLLTQPTIKVALGYSSAAHMGFMLLVCGLGVYPAAVLHLVAHSFYKAHAFLSSGSVVDVARSKRLALPNRRRNPFRVLASLLLAGGIYMGLAILLGFTPAEDPSLMAVGAILVMGLAQLLAPALDSAGTTAAMLRTTGLAVGVGLAFFSLEEGARLLLLSSLPEATEPSTTVIGLACLVLVAFGAAILLQIVGLNRRSRLSQVGYVHLRNGLYANAYFDRLVGALRN
ncbi:MAG: proton-conducting transporter membrane subunit [Myxococcota bacterium]